MSVGMVFRGGSILAFVAGAAWMLVPAEVMAAWGMEATPPLVFQARQQAALLLAAGMLLWVARDAAPSPARRAIIVGGFWAGVFVAFIWLDAVMQGTLPGGGLIGVVVGILVAVIFAGTGATEMARRSGGAAERGERGERARERGERDGEGGAGGRVGSSGPRGRRRRRTQSTGDGTDGPGPAPA